MALTPKKRKILLHSPHFLLTPNLRPKHKTALCVKRKYIYLQHTPQYAATLSTILLINISDGKFHLLPTGELLIHNLEYNDRFQTYRCRTMHRLTRQVVVSSPAKVRVNGKLVTSKIILYTYLSIGVNGRLKCTFVPFACCDCESWLAVVKLIFLTLMA